MRSDLCQDSGMSDDVLNYEFISDWLIVIELPLTSLQGFQLAVFVKANQRDWDEHVPFLLKIHSSIRSFCLAVAIQLQESRGPDSALDSKVARVRL